VKSSTQRRTDQISRTAKSEIRQFGNAIEYMVDQMSKRWRTQILKELNQDTISKFSDASQVGNFAKIFLAMAARVRRKLLKQFDDKRIENLAKKYTGKVDNRNKPSSTAAPRRRSESAAKSLKPPRV